MIIKNAVYETSVVSSDKFIQHDLQFAFAGRSNVGKSSFLNSLVGQKKLAKTSSLPGRTRMINYFFINDSFYFVDLPGYGYAKAGKQNKLMWATLMEEYLQSDIKLKRVFMLVDIRHDPSELDKTMLSFLTYASIPFTIIATKADKIAKSKIPAYVANIAKKLLITSSSIIAYSSENAFNKNKILEIIENDLNNVE